MPATTRVTGLDAALATKRESIDLGQQEHNLGELTLPVIGHEHRQRPKLTARRAGRLQRRKA